MSDDVKKELEASVSLGETSLWFLSAGAGRRVPTQGRWVRQLSTGCGGSSTGGCHIWGLSTPRSLTGYHASERCT